jgi:hypothetical protein
VPLCASQAKRAASRLISTLTIFHLYKLVGSRTVSRAVGSPGGCRLGGCLHYIPLRLHEVFEVTKFSFSERSL